MSRKVYTQRDMNVAIHEAKTEARLTQIQRSAAIMQSYSDKISMLEEELGAVKTVLATANNVVEMLSTGDHKICFETIKSMDEKLVATQASLAQAEEENASLRTGHTTCFEEITLRDNKIEALNDKISATEAVLESTEQTNDELRQQLGHSKSGRA